LNVECAEKLLPIYATDKRFIDIYGGRGSAKSWGVADFCLAKGIEKKRRFLCCREIQTSIKDSVHKLLSDRIAYYGLERFYTITDKQIVGKNGSEFIFKGLYRNVNDIKSTEGVDIGWVEEAHSVSRGSFETLIPTIRKDGSQIIFTYNPTNDDDPVHADYTLSNRDDVLRIEMNYSDNPWFPDVLKADMEYDRANNIDKYLHIWEGKCVKHSDAQIFKGKWSVKEFEAPKDAFFYFGADWGFSQDPTVLIRCFVTGTELFIDHEYYKVGLEITSIPDAFSSLPKSRDYPIFADSSRPDTISHVRTHGFPLIRPSAKGKGSIEDGVEHIKSYSKIYIHPRCTHMIDEMRLYSYATDRQTGLVSNKIEDKHNHCVDSLRYALEKLMKSKSMTLHFEKY
jgi:phage terminase large subunit